MFLTPLFAQIAALFFLHKKSHQELVPVLQLLKEKNPGWMPAVSMTDCDGAELLAIKQVFPDVHRLICDWHWKKALKKHFLDVFREFEDRNG